MTGRRNIPARRRRTVAAAASMMVVLLLGLLLSHDDRGSASLRDGGDASVPRMTLPSAPERAPLDVPETPRDPTPLAPPRGRIVPIERFDPERAYERTVLLAPDEVAVVSRVVDADGRPVAGARVLLYEFDSEWGSPFAIVLDETVTDADGRFALREDVSDESWYGSGDADRWRIAVRAESRPTWHGRPVAAGAPDEIVLQRGATVALELLFDDGAPVADASVREHIAPIEGFAAEDEQLLPYWTLGRTDARGRLDVLLDDGHRDPLLRIEHPDTLTTRRMPAPDDDGVARLVLPYDRALDVVWTGDTASWTARGLPPPSVWLRHVNETEFVTDAPTPERFRFTERSDASGQHFEHLTDEPVELRRGWSGPVLLEAFSPPVGRTRIELARGNPGPFVPGTSPWGLRVSARSTDPERLAVPRNVVARAADGSEAHLSAGALDWQGWNVLELAPPVSLFFADFGPDGPRVDGVGPGDVVELVLDAATRDAWSAAVRVDVASLGPERAGGARLSVQGEGDTWRREVPGLAATLRPGRWTLRVAGPGLERLERTVDLAAGDELVLEPRPAPLPDARPVDLRAPHAILRGTVRVEGDPWTFVERLHLRRTSGVPPREQTDALDIASDGTQIVTVRGGAFRTAVAPGEYDVEVRLARPHSPTRVLAEGRVLEDEWWLERFVARLDPPLHLALADGDVRELALVVPTLEELGLVLVHLTLDGAPPPAWDAAGYPSSFDATWTPSDGSPPRDVDDALIDGLLRLSLPPGDGVLRLARFVNEDGRPFHGKPADAVAVPLVVPPARDADGRPQALEIDVELREGDA